MPEHVLVTAVQVCQPFDPSKFNFRKALLSEALLQFEPAPAGCPAPSSVAPRTAAAAQGRQLQGVPQQQQQGAAAGPLCGCQQLLESVATGPSPTLVLINVSPIEYGHVLLVPRVLDCLPQVSACSCVWGASRTWCLWHGSLCMGLCALCGTV